MRFRRDISCLKIALLPAVVVDVQPIGRVLTPVNRLGWRWVIFDGVTQIDAGSTGGTRRRKALREARRRARYLVRARAHLGHWPTREEMPVKPPPKPRDSPA